MRFECSCHVTSQRLIYPDVRQRSTDLRNAPWSWWLARPHQQGASPKNRNLQRHSPQGFEPTQGSRFRIENYILQRQVFQWLSQKRVCGCAPRHRKNETRTHPFVLRPRTWRLFPVLCSWKKNFYSEEFTFNQFFTLFPFKQQPCADFNGDHSSFHCDIEPANLCESDDPTVLTTPSRKVI